MDWVDYFAPVSYGTVSCTYHGKLPGLVTNEHDALAIAIKHNMELHPRRVFKALMEFYKKEGKTVG